MKLGRRNKAHGAPLNLERCPCWQEGLALPGAHHACSAGQVLASTALWETLGKSTGREAGGQRADSGFAANMLCDHRRCPALSGPPLTKQGAWPEQLLCASQLGLHRERSWLAQRSLLPVLALLTQRLRIKPFLVPASLPQSRAASVYAFLSEPLCSQRPGQITGARLAHRAQCSRQAGVLGEQAEVHTPRPSAYRAGFLGVGIQVHPAPGPISVPLPSSLRVQA